MLPPRSPAAETSLLEMTIPGRMFLRSTAARFLAGYACSDPSMSLSSCSSLTCVRKSDMIVSPLLQMRAPGVE
jgi:hypothetical protein